MKLSFTFPKIERLKSRKQIARLFDTGQSQFIFPFKLLFIIDKATNDKPAYLQFTVSIPKKKIKKATKRNLIKRRTREAYRLNKSNLLKKLEADKNHKISLMFIYIDEEVKDYTLIEKSIIGHLNKLTNALDF